MLEERLLAGLTCSILLTFITLNRASAEAGPSQIDLESTKTDVICATQKKPLSCASPGSTIAVTGAFWGRLSANICPSDDGDARLDCGPAAETLSIVQGKCEGQDSCEVEARHSLLQNPGSTHCPGVNKYLIVNYTCVPDAKEVTICDSENTTLGCPANWKVNINSAFWGRQSVSVCPAQSGQTMCTGAKETIGLLKQRCDGSPKCNIHASSQTVQNGAENCPGVEKYLIVDYSCKPHPNIETSEFRPEAEELSEALPQSRAADVSQALNDMDSGFAEQVGSDVNTARLGMGGLKALEKINNLIRASAEEGGPPLSEEQAKNIERMIIAGIKEIKSKEADAKRILQQNQETSERTAIPRMKKLLSKSAGMKLIKVKRLPNLPLPAEPVREKATPKHIHIAKTAEPKVGTSNFAALKKMDLVAKPLHEMAPAASEPLHEMASAASEPLHEMAPAALNKEPEAQSEKGDDPDKHSKSKEDKHSTAAAQVFAQTKTRAALGIADFGNMP